jgi:hypothetical protein
MHSDPTHHIGACDAACRAGRRPHAHEAHLYRGPGSGRARAEFEARYGKRKGAYVYGATVGKVRREQAQRNRPTAAYRASLWKHPYRGRTRRER